MKLDESETHPPALETPSVLPARRPPSFPPRWRLGGVIVSSLAALLATALHVAALVTELGPSPLLVFVLMGSAVVSFVGMLIALLLGEGSRRPAVVERELGAVMLGRFARSMTALERIPPAALGVAVMVGFYGLINFLLVMGSLGRGVPTEQDGEFALIKRGVFVRSLSSAEFRHLQSLELRGLSGHALLFSGIAVLGFSFVVNGRPRWGGKGSAPGAEGPA